MTNLEKIERLELDVDSRLVDLWEQADQVEVWSLDKAAAFFRVAYCRGYEDSLTDSPEQTLFGEHGYKVPARRAA